MLWVSIAAQIPIKNDEEANTIALNKVHSDKLRELNKGRDGSWVAHPALASICNDVFNKLEFPNQIHFIPDTKPKTPEDFLNTNIENFRITENGIRVKLYIGLNYMESWIRGLGCVPISNLMEDAATSNRETDPPSSHFPHTSNRQ